MTPEELADRVDRARGHQHKPGRTPRVVLYFPARMIARVDKLRANLPEKASRAAVFRALTIWALEVAEREMAAERAKQEGGSP